MDRKTESKKLSKESSIYVIGEFLSKAFTFILLPIYTSYFSIEDFAIYSIVAMLWPVMLVLLGKSFSAFILRGYFDYTDKKEFLGSILGLSMIIGIGTAGIIHFFGAGLVSSIFKNYDYKPYLQYGLFFAIFRLFFNNVITIFRAKREPRKSVLLSIAQFAAHSIAVIISIVVLKTDLEGVLQAQLFAYMIVSILYLVMASREIKYTFRTEFVRPAIIFILPLQLHAAASWVVVYVSRIFIENSMAAVHVSIFAVATQLSFILTVINNGLNQAWSPFVYTNAERPDFGELFAVNARKLIVAISLLGTGMILFSPEVLTIMGKSAYLEAGRVFPILVAAYVFQMLYFIYVAVIIYHKNIKLLPVISASTGIICILINMFLVPVLGLYGAAVSTLVSFILMFAGVRSISRKYVQVRVIDTSVLLFLFLLVIISVIFYILGDLAIVPAIVLKVIILCGLTLMLDLLKIINLKDFIRSFSFFK